MPVRREGKLSSGELKTKMTAGLDRGLILGAMLVAQQATRNAPIETGRLKRSIAQGRPYSKPMMRRAIDVGTNVEYAAVHEFGYTFEEMEITAVRAKALAFKWPNAPGDLPAGKGGLHYFKKVTRPQITITAQPYLRPALRQKRQEVKTVIIRSTLGNL